MPDNQQNILTAQQFIAQGTTAGAIMSIAAGRPEVEAVAREVAAITGQSLKWPGQVTADRERAAQERRRRPANDNRSRRNRRAA